MGLDITYWGNLAGRTLTAPEIDANFKAMADAVEALQAASGGRSLVDITQDPTNATLTFALSDGTYLGPYAMPAMPIVPRGAWATGAQYEPGDLWTDQGSAYLALKEFVSGASAQADVDAGNALLLVKGGTDGTNGRDAENYRGASDPTLKYAMGDVVGVNPGTSAYNLFKAYTDDIPACTAPGTDQRWGRVTVEQIHDLRLSKEGPFSDGGVIGYTVVTRASIMLPGLAGSMVRLTAALAKAVNVNVYVNGTLVGTAPVAAGQTVPGAWTGGPALEKALAPGDVVLACIAYQAADSSTPTVGAVGTFVFLGLLLL